MPSLSDEDTEFWLEPEVRLIPMVGDRLKKFTGTRLMWTNLDKIVSHPYENESARDTFTLENIVKLALGDAELSGRPFEFTFESMIGYIANRMEEEGLLT